MKTILLLLAINWNADLTHLATEVPKMHPDPFRVTTREAFVADIEQLRARAPKMEPHEVIVDMARIVATLGEGHTRVSPPIDAAYGLFHPHIHLPLPKHRELHFRALPVRFTIHSGTLFNTEGRKVTHIGTMSAEEAIGAVEPVAHADNDMQRKDNVAAYLAIPEVLHARRVTKSLNEVPVTFADGERVVYKPLEAPPVAAPLETPWSFTYLEPEKTVWFQYNEVLNTDEETLRDFSERMFRFIDEHPVDKLVIDIRNNYGGNNYLNRPLIHGLIRSRKVQAPGSLFVLIGRRTYSAAMMFAVDVAQETHAIFIGEPTGGSPNSYGDPGKVILPESDLTVRVSKLYWQTSDPRDERDSLAPHISAPPAFGGDRARAVALDFFGEPASLDGTWEGTISTVYQRADFKLIDGKITSKGLKLDNVPLDETPFRFSLRAGTKRLAGTMTVPAGHRLLVVGERIR